ncbi:hypothetical protein [Rhizobium sp. Root1220]|uniref:hypothetical protein n=1 Tax=Rhizobium sp. Root1220 TaxID=1736432 RepID=UPI0006F3FA05|nr:hypothetical protein [Rhizobium sp. Root1220]KQV80489.1 hypothetical protein ASC90_25125 [Rhizobium sp. Root1220]
MAGAAIGAAAARPYYYNSYAFLKIGERDRIEVGWPQLAAFLLDIQTTKAFTLAGIDLLLHVPNARTASEIRGFS